MREGEREQKGGYPHLSSYFILIFSLGVVVEENEELPLIFTGNVCKVADVRKVHDFILVSSEQDYRCMLFCWKN